MKGKWEVMNNPMMNPTPYTVFRLRDTNEVMHSGNIETVGEFYEKRNFAEALAEKLNKEEK